MTRNPLTAARHVLGALAELDACLDATTMDDEQDLMMLATVFALLDRSQTAHRPGGIKQRVTFIIDEVSFRLGRMLPYKESRIIAGTGVIERSMGGRRYAWEDGRLLAHRIASRVADELRTNADGEVIDPPPPGVIAGHVADALIDCGGLDNASASWRTSALDRVLGESKPWKHHRHLVSEGRLGARWLD